MPITVKDIEKRLGKHTSVMKLKERDMQHTFSILKSVGKRSQGLSISEMKKHYLGKALNFSNTHLVASLNWLKKKEYLITRKGKGRQKLYVLTEKGRAALHDLDDYFYSPETSLKISWNLPDPKEGEASLTAKLPDIWKTAVFSNKFIRDRIVELSAALFFPEGVSLTIRIPALGSKGILAFLRVLWGFYWQKVTDPPVKPNIFGPLYINMYLTDEKGIESYTEFWKKHVEKFLQYEGRKFITVISSGEKKQPVERPLFPLLPPELEGVFPVFLKDEEIKQWVECQLEKEPDWFMPHLVWVRLGFKQRRKNLSADSVIHVSSPFFHEITSPSLPSEYGLFDSMIRIVGRKGDEKNVRTLCMWIANSANWRGRDFYKSWRILRKEYREKIHEVPKFGEVARVLDEAFRRYILADHRPNVDLSSIFRDYLLSEDTEAVETGIREGKYNLTVR